MLLVGGLEVYTGMCTHATGPEDGLKYVRISTRHLPDMLGMLSRRTSHCLLLTIVHLQITMVYI